MKLYLKWLDRYERQDGEESPIGLILCTEVSREQVELLEMHRDGIVVAEYWTALPPKAELEASSAGSSATPANGSRAAASTHISPATALCSVHDLGPLIADEAEVTPGFGERFRWHPGRRVASCSNWSAQTAVIDARVAKTSRTLANTKTVESRKFGRTEAASQGRRGLDRFSRVAQRQH
jgi:hypothetical protein